MINTDDEINLTKGGEQDQAGDPHDGTGSEQPGASGDDSGVRDDHDLTEEGGHPDAGIWGEGLLYRDNPELKEFGAGISGVQSEIAKVIVGQDELIELMLVAMLCGDHVLIEGVPGIAKTLAAKMLHGHFPWIFRASSSRPILCRPMSSERIFST
jgi:hypothetical protein